MRKVVGLLAILMLTFGTVASFAATRYVILKPTIQGKQIARGTVKVLGPDHQSFANFKAQNHLSAATNNLIKTQQKGAQFKNCAGFLSVPCFNSWFITGYRNSVYTYSMVGSSPTAGGTTGIDNELIPVITRLFDANGNLTFVYNPTIANDPEGSDVSLTVQSPLYDATTTYPGGGGLPADKGQIIDTMQRAGFHGVAAANWHTPLNPPSSPHTQYVMDLFEANGDWTTTITGFPTVNINSIFNVFSQIVGPTREHGPSTTVPIILTDFVTAFDPSNNSCCILGFHTAQPGNEGGNSVLIWTWATFFPHSNDPFAPIGDVAVLTHEIGELYNDPFVNTFVSPWVDGSVQFASPLLETGDAIEAMKDADVLFPVPLNTTGGPYVYNVVNQALLQWFMRNPKAPENGPGPGVYSWPNTSVLNDGHPCPSKGWVYGEGPAGFFFDDGTATAQCH